MRRFELRDEKSSKFWEIQHEGNAVTVCFGKIGAKGQTQSKSFANAEKAKAEAEKLIREKTGKGYVEAGKDKAPTAAAVSAPAPKKKTKTPPAQAIAPKEEASAGDGFLDAGGGYSVALRDGKIVCKGAKGILASVPKAVKESEVALALGDLRDWLETHERETIATVEGWMLRSLPTPRAVLEAVWADPAWRSALENAVVVPVSASGGDEGAQTGFFRGVDAKKGIGVVTLDGETVWIDAAAVALPHPILLAERDDFRALALELSFTQGIAQLLRETYEKPTSFPADANAIRAFSGGEFEKLSHVLGLCRRVGYRIAGGSAVTRVWEDGRVSEARFWVGADDPEAPASTGGLGWVDDNEKPIALSGVGAVAFSEGMRMANRIYAGRVIPKEGQSG